MEDINITLDKAIRAKDLETVRNIMTTAMVQDPGFSKGVFEERLKRCLASLSNTDIFVPFEGDPINTNPDEWTKDYYFAQQTKFRYNFSLERLEHLKKVGRKLYPSVETEPSHVYEEAPRGNYSSGQSSGKQQEDFPKWLIPVGIGAAALILLWILFARK
ncbi:hypothetical protein FACS189461_3800 [Spirochaetia bacterium]|nr:hypothetical protein FACS189461_3800 [Spirochaetia bacterium]